MYKAINNSIIAKIEKKAEKVSATASGLVLVAAPSKDGTTTGIVVSVSDRYTDKGFPIPNEIQVGDKILIPLNSGQKLDEEHVMILHDEVFAVIK